MRELTATELPQRLLFLERLIQQAIEEFEDEAGSQVTDIHLYRHENRLRAHLTITEDRDA